MGCGASKKAKEASPEAAVRAKASGGASAENSAPPKKEELALYISDERTQTGAQGADSGQQQPAVQPKDFQREIERVQESIDREPNDYKHRVALAKVLLESGGDGERAFADLEAALAADPHDFECRGMYGAALAKRGETEKAQEVFSEGDKLLKQKHTMTLETLFFMANYAAFASAQGESGNASAMYDKMSKLSTKDCHYLPGMLNCAVFRAHAGDKAGAKKALEKAIGWASSSPEQAALVQQYMAALA